MNSFTKQTHGGKNQICYYQRVSGGGKKNYKFGIIYTLLYIKQALLYSTGNNI